MYTPSDPDPAGQKIRLNHAQTAHVRKKVPFRTSFFWVLGGRITLTDCEPELVTFVGFPNWHRVTDSVASTGGAAGDRLAAVAEVRGLNSVCR